MLSTAYKLAKWSAMALLQINQIWHGMFNVVYFHSYIGGVHEYEFVSVHQLREWVLV